MIEWTNLDIEYVGIIETPEGVSTDLGEMLVLNQIIEGSGLIKEHWISKVLVKEGHYVTHGDYVYEVLEVISVSRNVSGEWLDKVGLRVKKYDYEQLD